jgi:hypothetical protein
MNRRHLLNGEACLDCGRSVYTLRGPLCAGCRRRAGMKSANLSPWEAAQARAQGLPAPAERARPTTTHRQRGEQRAFARRVGL